MEKNLQDLFNLGASEKRAEDLRIISNSVSLISAVTDMVLPKQQCARIGEITLFDPNIGFEALTRLFHFVGLGLLMNKQNDILKTKQGDPAEFGRILLMTCERLWLDFRQPVVDSDNRAEAEFDLSDAHVVQYLHDVFIPDLINCLQLALVRIQEEIKARHSEG